MSCKNLWAKAWFGKTVGDLKSFIFGDQFYYITEEEVVLENWVF